jgi:hypothetical protein
MIRLTLIDQTGKHLSPQHLASDVYKRVRLKRTAEQARQREGLRKELKAEILDDMKRHDSNT